MTSKAVVLFSGGLDSTTCLAVASEAHTSVHALSFDYGQKHRQELAHAQRLSKQLRVSQHLTLSLPTDLFQGSALTDPSIEVLDFHEQGGIPNTYVPARNTLFLSYALAYAESIAAQAIYMGVSAVDYSGYPDCRPAFIDAFQNLANLATKRAVEGHPIKLHTPLLHWSKAETILLGLAHGVDYGATVSCYRSDGAGRACGTCDSCVLRKKGFDDAGVQDPTRYIS